MKFLWTLLVALLALATPALAQNPQTVKLCIPTSGTVCPPVTAAAPLPVSGVFSATLAGFTPNGNYTTLTATAASSASTALPAGVVVAFQNLSAIDVSCVLSAGAATATTNKLIVRAGATVYYTVGSNVNAACINQTGVAANVVGLAGGAGLGTAFGGASSGGGGGGGAVTVADGADIALGATADAASAAGGTGTLSAKLRLMTTQLGTINTTLGTPLQTGGAVAATLTAETTKVIGTVRIASGGVASGSYASGAFASGAFASGALASGSIASGAMVDLLTVIGTKNAGTAAASSLLIGGVYNSTPITLTNTQQSSAQLDANGYIKVNVAAGGAGGGAATIADGADVTQGALADAASSAGGTGSLSAKLRLMTTQLDTINTTLGGSIPAGTALIGDVNIRQGGTALSATNGAFFNQLQGNAVLSATNPIFVANVPTTAGGVITDSKIITTANGVLNLKASAGQVYKIEVSNNSATVAWLKLYNSASTPTAGSGTPAWRILIPGNSSGVVFSGSYDAGLVFGTGIGYALTGLIGDSDTTAVTASVITVNIGYK